MFEAAKGDMELAADAVLALMRGPAEAATPEEEALSRRMEQVGALLVADFMARVRGLTGG